MYAILLMEETKKKVIVVKWHIMNESRNNSKVV